MHKGHTPVSVNTVCFSRRLQIQVPPFTFVRNVQTGTGLQVNAVNAFSAYRHVYASRSVLVHSWPQIDVARALSIWYEQGPTCGKMKYDLCCDNEMTVFKTSSQVVRTEQEKGGNNRLSTSVLVEEDALVRKDRQRLPLKDLWLTEVALVQLRDSSTVRT